MEEMKVISTENAYKLYLSEGYDNIMPFDSLCEYNFLELLGRNNIAVVDEVPTDGESGSN